MEAKLHAEQAQMESKIKTEKAKIQATNAALEADLDLLATKGEAAAAEAEALALEETKIEARILRANYRCPKWTQMNLFKTTLTNKLN